ncbi:MAG: NAD(P)-dependent oxidoreductase, partial [Pseudomonadota bacterium]
LAEGSVSMKIGVAGCGRMGFGMARAMARSGLDVTGFDVRPIEEFGEFANRMAADPGSFAGDREVIITVVRDIAQTEALLFDEQAILGKSPRLRYLVVSSTLSPRYFASLAERMPEGVIVIDAPMSGAQVAADEGRLSFMLGGEEADLDLLQPAFEAMGTKIHRVGPAGAGMTAKVLNNFVAGSAMAGVRQALDWAGDLGVDRERLLALMHDSSGQTWFGSNFDQIEFARNGYDVENTVGILKKDLESCLDAVDPETHSGFPEALVAAIGRLKPIN